MKKRIFSAILAALTLSCAALAADGGIYQGHVVDGALAGSDDTDIIQGHIVDGVLSEGGGGVPAGESAAAETFTVIFDAGSADANLPFSSKTVTAGKTYGELPVPSRTGYVFRGWYSAVRGAWVSANTVVRLAGDEVLSARWDSAACTVTLDAAGGMCAAASLVVLAGTPYGELPVPSRTGYAFDAWFNADGERIEIDTPVPDRGDHTLYARWKADTAPGLLAGLADIARSAAAGIGLTDAAASESGESEPKAVFSDVPAGSSYFNAVNWAVQKGITSGTTPETFSPNAPCKRKYILTFLWRANGCPESSSSDSYSLDRDSVFGKGALWAYHMDLISESEYRNAEEASTRADTVTYLWKLDGSPSVGADALSGALDRFDDVSPADGFAQAVAWALDRGITNGTTETTFSPHRTCTRGQIVTFLYRCYSH